MDLQSAMVFVAQVLKQTALFVMYALLIIIGLLVTVFISGAAVLLISKIGM
jgi:hypothetical protein